MKDTNAPSAARKLAALACGSLTLCIPPILLFWLVLYSDVSDGWLFAVWLAGLALIWLGQTRIYRFWFRLIAGMEG